MNFFVTGTDTGIGKTLISCALLHAFRQQDKSVAGMKPVAAGYDGDALNDDVKQLRDATNILATLGQINPYSLPLAVAPHIAAKHAGISINFERILESYRELASKAEVVIVEGVGGFQVPLNDTQDSADLAVALNIPMILVVGMRLGCLNHALLTQRALQDCRLRCAGWVANVIDAEMPMLQENIQSLRQRINAPLLGTIPYQENKADPRLIANLLDISLLKGSATL